MVLGGKAGTIHISHSFKMDDGTFLRVILFKGQIKAVQIKK